MRADIQIGLGRRATFALIALIVAISAYAATAYGLWRLRAASIDRHFESAAMTASAFEDHLTQSFNVIDRTLSNLADQPAGPQSLTAVLRQAPYLRSVALLGPDNAIFASSDLRNVGIRLNQREFLPLTDMPVDVLRVGPLRAGRDLYDSVPLGSEPGLPSLSVLPVVRDVQRGDEKWVSVAAAVNVDYFLNFYSHYIHPGAGKVQLLRYDGHLLLSTDETDRPGAWQVDSTLLARVAKSEVGVFEESLANGRIMLTAYRASRAFPFLLVVRLDKENGLAAWRLEAARTIGIVSAVLLVALVLVSLYYLRFERVARERERDQERLRIAAIAFEAQEGLVVTDVDAKVLRINHAFTAITGFTAEEVLGKTMSFLHSGQHEAHFYAEIRATVAKVGAWSGEMLNRHKDGSIHPHFVSISAVPDSHGKITHFVGALSDITDRKRAEESLRTLSRAVAQSPTSIVITDPDGLIQYVNPKFEAITGYTSNEVIGKNPRVLSSGEKPRAEYREMWATLLAGGTWQGEFHNRRKDGSLFWEHASISPVFNEAGELLHYVAVKEDITARKQAEARINELNRDFVAFLENTSDFIYFKDRDSRFRFCSQTLAKITHHANWRDMIGKHDREVFPPENAQIYQAEEVPIFQSGIPLLNKIDPYLDVDGNLGWVSTNKWPLLDADGQVTGLFGISRDITQQIKANQKLQLAASVFTHSREGIMITAPDGEIIDVNEAFTRITGYGRDEIIGRNPRVLSSGLQDKQYFAAFWQELTANGYWNGEVWNRRKGGEFYAVMQTISAVRDDAGQILQYLSLFSDITALKEHERQLEHIAHFDALTHLPNRILLADRMQQAMTQSRRRERPLAVAYLDLDGFKAINDQFGHDAGDQLLITVAARMKESLREGDTFARLGGDEFVAVLLDLESVSDCEPMLARLLGAAAQPVHSGDLVLQVSASLGVTFFPQAEEVDADQLLRQADQAMYQAKLAGKNRYYIYDAEQARSLRGKHESLERIRKALNRSEFVLHYQPKVNMRSGKLIGAEALIRWQQPEKGLLPPAVFLSVIEGHDLAIELGEWVIDTALKQISRWQAEGLHIPVSINIGARQLQQADFAERLRARLAAQPEVSPGDLELEVLETSALEDLAHVSKVISECREFGVNFALDDFGTGYSSLSYLKRLPVALLKIDQSFVRDMLDDPDDLAILEGVIGLATAFRHQIIAEGVETIEHGEMLLRLGCELAQGYGIARPMPAAALPAWYQSWQPHPIWRETFAVKRDDLALLFAGVEHRAWVLELENHLSGQQSKVPALDEHQCRFGQWLDAKGLLKYGTQPEFQAIAALHRQVHDLAEDLLQSHSAGCLPEVRDRLSALLELRDDLLTRLRDLLARNEG